MTKPPKDFGRIKMEEDMLRQDAKRRMKAWREKNEITGATHLDKKYTWKDYLYIIPAILLVVYIIIRSVI